MRNRAPPGTAIGPYAYAYSGGLAFSYERGTPVHGTVSPDPRRAVPGGIPLQEYLAHKNAPATLGPPCGPRHRPTVGPWEAALFCERGTPSLPPVNARYRDTSRIRNNPPVGPYSSPVPRDLP